jgi:uncharacterized SAM-binding protein YcdF (DUF218 family)
MSGFKRARERGGIIVNLIVLLFFAVLCAVLYFARHPIMRYAAEEWIVDEPAAHADAIVVLSDDNFYGDRATHASELFRQGVAPQIVASGRKLRPDAGMGELIAHDLVERGIPQEKIVVYDQQTDSTREEAEAVAKLAVAHHWKSLVIVTSNYHTRRARYIYEKVMPSSISISVASARDGDFDPQHWWEKRHSVKLFTREWAGMAEAIWELRNVHPSETTGDTKNSQLIPVFPEGTILHTAVGNPVQKSRLSLYIVVSAVLS